MDKEAVEYVLDVLRGNLKPKNLERHRYGEVFTPLELVDEMLSTLPPRAWTDPTLRWLDPACGIGNFPIKAFLGQREGPHRYPGLYNGLRSAIPDDRARCKHILERMLFMIDINVANLRIVRELLGRLCPWSESNVDQVDRSAGFLTEKPLRFRGGKHVMDTFDIIMGNPPFQRGSVRAALVTNRTRKRARNLGVEGEDRESMYWVRFVRKALEGGALKRGGFLLFIHPITWFKHDRVGAHDLILSHRLHSIKIFKNNGPGTAFGSAGKISVAWYCLQNVPASPTFKTEVRYGADAGLVEHIALSTDSILILRYNSIYQKILRRMPLFKDAAIATATATTDAVLKHTTIPSCVQSGRGPYKMISDIHDDGGMEYVRSVKAHPDQNVPKLIVGGLHKPVVYFDRRGEYGLFSKGQRSYFVGNEGELRRIQAFFKTRLSTLLLRFIKFEQDFIRPGYFPDVRGLDVDTISDEGLAHLFGFSAAERKAIAGMEEPIFVRSLTERLCSPKELLQMR